MPFVIPEVRVRSDHSSGYVIHIGEDSAPDIRAIIAYAKWLEKELKVANIAFDEELDEEIEAKAKEEEKRAQRPANSSPQV